MRKQKDHNPDDAKRYKEHRQKYPYVLDRILEYSRQAIKRGQRRWSVGSIVDIIRWNEVQDLGLEKDKDGYAINDHLASFYSREIQLNNSDLLDFFECRVAGADWEPLGPNGLTWARFQQGRIESEMTETEANRAAKERKKTAQKALEDDSRLDRNVDPDRGKKEMA
jgi:hypothetical protein